MIDQTTSAKQADLRDASPSFYDSVSQAIFAAYKADRLPGALHPRRLPRAFRNQATASV